MRVAARGPPWLESSLFASRPRVKGVVYSRRAGGFYCPVTDAADRTPPTRAGLARPLQIRRTPRVAAPGVHVPRRRRLQLRWVAPRSLAKTGLRRKGDVRPKICAGARFRIPGPTAARTGASPPPRCIPGAMSAGRGLGAEIPGHPREDAVGKGVRTAKV